MKILLIVNLCAHYRIKLFELLAKMYSIRFLFFSKGENYYDGNLCKGDFKGEYSKGYDILPRLRINPALIKALFCYDYDIAIKCINGPLPVLLTFLISKFRRKKFILWTGVWHHPRTLFHRISFPITKLFYKYSDAICVYGNHIKDYLISIGIDSRKIFIVQKAADNSSYDRLVKNEKVTDIKKKMKIADKKVLLYVGRFEKVKGLDFLIRAFLELKRKDSVLLWIGRGSEEGNLRKLAGDSISQGRIIFHDYIDNNRLVEYYALADVFTLPSVTTLKYKETWGMAINEAMNQACPIICTEAVGAAAGGLVRNGVNGLVVPEKNVVSLMNSIEIILDDDRYRKDLGINAKKIVSEYTIERKAEGFKKAIEYAVANEAKFKNL